MPINEPTPPEKIFTDEFAKSGEVEKVPNDLSGDERLSWLGGFTRRFSRIPAKENGLNVIRQTFAGIVQPISAKIIQAENYLRTRFFKTDSAKIENSDISYLETPQLTAQNLNAQTGKITDFSHELIKPKEKTIITDLTQNAGVIKSVDSLSIVDKAGSVNIILSPNTSKSVLNNTPPDEAEGKELINAEWMHSNGTAPSPYVHSFTGSSTTIPYSKIRGLKWFVVHMNCDRYGKPITNIIYASNNRCGFYLELYCWTEAYGYVYTPDFITGDKEKELQVCSATNRQSCSLNRYLKYTYSKETGLFRITQYPVQNTCFILSTTLYFSKDGKD